MASMCTFCDLFISTCLSLEVIFSHDLPWRFTLTLALGASNGYPSRINSLLAVAITSTSALFFQSPNKLLGQNLDSLAYQPSSRYDLPNCTFLNFNLDYFLGKTDTRRLRNMLIQARWDEMRQKMQVVKNAYIGRHYTQCAKLGERLLAEVQGEVSHTLTH
jgi:hypothetical protein